MARIMDTDASVLAAQAGVSLDGDAARNAAVSMERPLALADAAARLLAFEAEPAQFLPAQQRSKA
jgi:hypothetical protein